jgi:hypothetical protein
MQKHRINTLVLRVLLAMFSLATWALANGVGGSGSGHGPAGG